MKFLTLLACLSVATFARGADSAAAFGQRFPSARRHSAGASNPSGVFALYQNPLFGFAQRLPALTENPDAILKQNGILAVNANADERSALAKGISHVNRLLGGLIPSDWRVNFQWIVASGPWNSEQSRAGYVTIKRPLGSPNGKLTGRMMHELGHKFGHANDAQVYGAYSRYTRGKRCFITTYCHTSINEEFAEVFEAFVTNPEFLAKNCPASFAFLQTEIFRNSTAVLASSGQSENQPAHNEHFESSSVDVAEADLKQDDAVEESSDL